MFCFELTTMGQLYRESELICKPKRSTRGTDLCRIRFGCAVFWRSSLQENEPTEKLLLTVHHGVAGYRTGDSGIDSLKKP